MKSNIIKAACIALPLTWAISSCGPQDADTHRSETETMNPDEPAKPWSATDTTGNVKDTASPESTHMPNSSYRSDHTRTNSSGPGQ